MAIATSETVQRKASAASQVAIQTPLSAIGQPHFPASASCNKQEKGVDLDRSRALHLRRSTDRALLIKVSGIPGCRACASCAEPQRANQVIDYSVCGSTIAQ
jgi:hypothetical protein